MNQPNKFLFTFFMFAFIFYFNVNLSISQVTDIDGNLYQTVKIGNQEWMAENLNVEHYRNGDIIPQVQDEWDWGELTTGAWCYYDNGTENGKTYGKLYNWYAVNDSRGLAPEGWYIPDDSEWKTLEDTLGGYLVGGGKLKANLLWEKPNTGATNETEFSAIPGGLRTNYGEFDGINNYNCFWTLSEGNHNDAWTRVIFFDNSDIYRDYYLKPFGLSVRCLKNYNDIGDEKTSYKKIVFTKEKDYNLYSYIQTEFEFNKANKIKNIKDSWRKIHYNTEGELTKIEFGNNPVWGVLDVIKVDDRYYYKTTEGFDKEYKEIDRRLLIHKRWPYEETIVWSEIILDGSNIELEYTFFNDIRYADFYIYNENNKVDKIMTYSFSYEYNLPMRPPKDYKITFNNKNIIPELVSVTKFIYDNSGKLINKEYNDIKNNEVKSFFLQYNERGLESNDGQGESIEYEYYE